MSTTTQALNSKINIEGLQWIDRWRINNGRPGSFVVPFPTTRPVNIVTHGEKRFDYGQYGIHLAQQDVLTFLGDSSQVVHARFIDCRKTSTTFRAALEIEFSPSSSRTLVIPSGVAHTFSGLEGISTLNAYSVFLPPIEDMLKGALGWTPENDIINLPLSIDPTEVEGLMPMPQPASNRVYYRLASLQASTLSGGNVSHAETRNFILDTGEQVRLMLQPRAESLAEAPRVPRSKIKGVRFERHNAVRTGDDSRIMPVAGPSPFYIVDHGVEPYNFDSFGVHLGQEDHLTFLGSSCRNIRLKLVDMRRGSETLHYEEWHEFSCDPQMELIIPCGVAHALFNMEGVFTLNRPVIYLDELGAYEPGKDVIDWPLTDQNYPVFNINRQPASLDYMERLVVLQRQAMAEKAAIETPKAVIVNDPVTGKQVKVVLTRAAPVVTASAS
jgi:dTDP-4-dehydrorhamnose 3,5-epimerase-like enzyme